MIRPLLKPGGLLFMTPGNARSFHDRITKWRYVTPDVRVSLSRPLWELHLRRRGFRTLFGICDDRSPEAEWITRRRRQRTVPEGSPSTLGSRQLQSRFMSGANEVPSGSIDYSAAPNHPRLRAVASSLSFRARRKMFQQFMATVRPAKSDAILDVGVTPDTSLVEGNYFEKLYPYRDRITATSVEDASNLEDVFPGLTFVRTEGVKLPFADHQFDIAFSSAVIEHVGNLDCQREFVSELLRVSKRGVFILTPNRWFPIDFHTVLPLIHWLPQSQHQRILRALGYKFWSETNNLNLLSSATLRSLFPPDTPVTMECFRTLGWPSNLMAYAISS